MCEPLIGYEKDYSKHTFTMEMVKKKDGEDLWNKRIFVNER